MDWYAKMKESLRPLERARIADEHSIVSAVIIPMGFNEVTGRDEILLTKRTDLVHTHKNEVGFPGGVYDTEDGGDMLRTAMREMEEEIGVSKEHFEVLGRLNPVMTIGSVVIFPFVAKMQFPYPYVLNPHEVARVLYLPVQQLLEQGLTPMEVPTGKHKVKSIGIYAEGELVWGASAKMLDELRELLLKA